MNPEYRVYLNDELLCKTTWPPHAQAAWDRASRDRDAAQHGGVVLLLVDGREVARVTPRTGVGHPWPGVGSTPVGRRDVAHAVLLLARVAGANSAAVAQELSATGLPTSPARLKSITTGQAGRRAEVSDAELVSICYAAVGALRRQHDA